MSIALASIVDSKNLKNAIDFFKPKYGILQSVSQIYIGEVEELKKELKGEIEPSNFESGRLFLTDSEIRWRKKGEERFYVLIISDKDLAFNGYERNDLEMVENYLSFYLWGEKSEDMWCELRIPKGWRYPVKNQYTKIKVIGYELKEKPEEGKLYRFYDFEGEENEPL
ncbi:MAG: hypothetical protein DDT22_00424 [candidate division WS2 bacterium]|nr:hypothetical protein [Candidatus Lithacetigena glycinireducens]MBT9174763.1 hypothetical protein [Candidatus Lithacetigena glycinireducens]